MKNEKKIVCYNCKFFNERIKKCIFNDFARELKLKEKVNFDSKNNTCNKFSKK